MVVRSDEQTTLQHLRFLTFRNCLQVPLQLTYFNGQLPYLPILVNKPNWLTVGALLETRSKKCYDFVCFPK